MFFLTASLLSTFMWLLDIVLFVVAFPAILIVLLPFWMYKNLVLYVTSILYPNLDLTSLNGCESLLIFDPIPGDNASPDSEMTWNLGLDLRLKKASSFTIESFREKFWKLFLQIDSSGNPNPQFVNLFKYLIRFGGYTFLASAPSLDIESCIYETVVPPNQDLKTFLYSQLKKQYKPRTPFWKIMIMPNPEVADELVLFFKIHHSISDGQTLITHILARLTDLPFPQVVSGEIRKTDFDTLKLAIQAPRLLWTAFTAVKNTQLPFALITGERSEFFCMVNLDVVEMKIIRQKTGCKFICIFLTLIGGVLRRVYLEKSDERNMPDYVFSTIASPLPNHPSLCSNESRMCNYWTAGLVKIPLKPESSLERLKLLMENFDDFAGAKYQRIAKAFAIDVMGILPDFLRKVYRNFTTSALQLEYSENMGSAETQYLNGTPITGIQVMIIASAIKPAISGLSFSYNNQFNCHLKLNQALCGSEEGSDRIASIYFREAIKELLKDLKQ